MISFKYSALGRVALRAWAVLLIVILNAISPVFGQTSPELKALLGDGKLEIKAWVEPQEGIVVSQQVILNIEVATHRWFTGGTQIGLLEIDDAIVLRRDRFAVNSSRRQGGESWAVQLWSLTLYPQRAGVFDIPEIPLTLTISGEDNQTITGTVSTQAISFEAFEPSVMKGKPSWLATPHFEVTEEYDKDSVGLALGDSLQRTIRFKANNAAAMMFPDLTFEPMQGLAVYQKPADIKDSANRGEYLAERTESISYVVELAGEYRLPALMLYWWNLNSQELQIIVLPERLVSTKDQMSSESLLVGVMIVIFVTFTLLFFFYWVA